MANLIVYQGNLEIPTCRRKYYAEIILPVNLLDILATFISVGYPRKYYGFFHPIKKYRFLKLFSLYFLFTKIPIKKQENIYTFWRIEDFVYRMEASEKNLLSYELGMTFAHLISERLLNVIWTFHLQLAKQYGYLITHSKGYSPDLIGFDGSANFHIIEAKGSLKGYLSSTIKKAKDQAQSISSVNNQRICSHNVSYFIAKEQQPISVFFIDPKGDKDASINLNLEKAIYYFYKDVFDIAKEEKVEEKLDDLNFIGFYIGPFFIGIYDKIYRILEKIDKHFSTESDEKESHNFKEIFKIVKEDIFSYKEKKEKIISLEDRNFSLTNGGILLRIDNNFMDLIGKVAEICGKCSYCFSKDFFKDCEKFLKKLLAMCI